MKNVLCTALLVSAAVFAARASSTAKAPSTGEEREPEQEDESDSAPFMIVVEHTNGRRCGGSLVSLRTALTSAWCARDEGGAEPRELWALAPGAGATRRVARVALAAGTDAAQPADAWSGAAMDLAVLELEAPFGGGARSRPILMATQSAECAPRSACHVVRALGRSPRLRIVDAALVPGDTCAARARGWSGLRDSALCLVGATLCSSDWGAGVVCEGKLCGVLSRSARSETLEPVESSEAPERDGTCGDTHVAQSVARWRRFLHCAHTLRACGRGGDCAQLCTERRLLDNDAADTTPGRLDGSDSSDSSETSDTSDAADSSDHAEPRAADTPLMQRTTALPLRLQSSAMARPLTGSPPTRSQTAPRSTTPALLSSAQPSPRPAFEFEPNRPDFKGGPASTSRVYLKAGEYGDNAAEYGGEEAGLPTGSSAASASATPAPTAPPDASDPRTARAVLAHEAPLAAASCAAPRHHLVALMALLYLIPHITNLSN